MRKIISTALAVAMLAASSLTFVGEAEARRGGKYYERHHHHERHYDRRHRRGDDAAAAAIIGLALGAIIVGTQQQSRRGNTYYDDRSYRNDGYDRRDAYWEHVRRCEARYRSYDRRSDTFIGRDGRRYYCNL